MAWKQCIGTEIGVRGWYITVLCICACVMCTSEYTGSIEKIAYALHLNCSGGALESLPPWSEDYVPKLITLFRCQAPKETFKTSWHALGINITNLQDITLVDTPNQPPLLDSHFSDLLIHWLNITTNAFDPPESYNVYNYKDKRITHDVIYTRNEMVLPPLQLTKAKYLKIKCSKRMPLEQQPTQPRPLTVSSVRLYSCPSPQRSYAAALNAANINTTTIERLELLYRKHRLLLSHLEGLPIKYLKWQASGLRPYLPAFQMDQAAMNVNLVELSVSHVILHTLVPSQLINVTLKFGISRGNFGECAQLQRLWMQDWRIPEEIETRDGWLSHCPRLTNLIMIQPSPFEVKYALRGASALISLQIKNCRLSYLSEELLKDSPNLRYLNLKGNWLSSIAKETFAGLKNLVFVSLANNAFSSFHSEILRHVMARAVHLKTLDLSYNKFLDFCNSKQTHSIGFILEKADRNVMKSLPSVEKLLLANTSTTTLCFSRWIALRHLDVSNCKINKLSVGAFPSNTTSKVVVIATNNPVETIECYYCEKHLNATIVGDFSLDCDCQLGEMTRNLSQMPYLSIKGAFCKEDTRGPHQHLAFASPTRQECSKHECSPCTCRHSTTGIMSGEADCNAKDLSTVPWFQTSIRTILASRNHIQSLDNIHFHEKLLFINLSYNSISHLDEKSSEALFADRRRVALVGNTMACNCEKRSWLQTLQQYQFQVVDYNNVTCAGGGRVADISIEALCSEPLNSWMPMASFAVVAAAALAAFVLIRRYQRSLKLFLFTRGWCMSCIREREMDADFEFDAFLSFCHADDEFVVEQLVPGLNAYQLCVHYRDWEAGGWIPAQISRSVHHSRRTIVVVSHNFLKSQWGLLEFRTAHAISLEEGRARIIVILVDDVLSDPRLDAEMSTYLKTNTYVKWGDPWFFQKLRYALPHVQSPAAEAPLVPAQEEIDRMRNAIQLYRISDNSTGVNGAGA